MSEWDGEVEVVEHKLTPYQVDAVMRMMEVLRDDINLEMVLGIKKALAKHDGMEARNLWEGFTEQEQNALWVAPTYGGIFTTKERSKIRGENG